MYMHVCKIFVLPVMNLNCLSMKTLHLVVQVMNLYLREREKNNEYIFFIVS